jgi:hypothetical protein
MMSGRVTVNMQIVSLHWRMRFFIPSLPSAGNYSICFGSPCDTMNCTYKKFTKSKLNFEQLFVMRANVYEYIELIINAQENSWFPINILLPRTVLAWSMI